MTAPTVAPELRALLRRVKLGRCLDTLPERLALAHTDMSLQPGRSLDTARITARLDHLQHRRPAITRGLGLQP